MHINYIEYLTNGEKRTPAFFIAKDSGDSVAEEHHDLILKEFEDEFGNIMDEYKALRQEELNVLEKKSKLLDEIKSIFKTDFVAKIKVTSPEIFV